MTTARSRGAAARRVRTHDGNGHHDCSAPKTEYIDAHGIFVRFMGESRGAWLAPKGNRNNRRVHAALARTTDELEKFERIAEEIREANRDAVVEVRKL